MSTPAQPPTMELSSPPAARKSAWPKILLALGAASVMSCLCCGGLGSWIAWKEEGHQWGQPGDELQSLPVRPGEPIDLTFTWDGVNYAFHEVWVELDGQDKDGFQLKGAFDCARGGQPADKPIDTTHYTFAEARRQQHGDGRFTTWYRVYEEYARASPEPYRCVGAIDADPGSIQRARVVVTRRQRPSDFLAF
jgi:hypothetical protein